VLTRLVSACQTQVRFSRALIGLALGHVVMFLLLLMFLLLPIHGDAPSRVSFLANFSITLLMSGVIFGWWMFGTNGLLMLTAFFSISIVGMVFKRFNVLILIVCFVTALGVDYYFGNQFKSGQGIDAIKRIPDFEGLDTVGKKWLISTGLVFIQVFPVLFMALYIFFDPDYRKRYDL
jgi:hypothetical protein